MRSRTVWLTERVEALQTVVSDLEHFAAVAEQVSVEKARLLQWVDNEKRSFDQTLRMAQDHISAVESNLRICRELLGEKETEFRLLQARAEKMWQTVVSLQAEHERCEKRTRSASSRLARSFRAERLDQKGIHKRHENS